MKLTHRREEVSVNMRIIKRQKENSNMWMEKKKKTLRSPPEDKSLKKCLHSEH